MSYLKYLENKQHETGEFPMACYPVDESHPFYKMALHWHKETELIFVRAGEMKLIVNDREYWVRAGEVCYIPDGCIHEGEPINCVYECVDFDLNAPALQIPALQNVRNKIAEENGTILPLFSQEQPEVLRCVERMLSYIQQPNDGLEILFLSGLLEFYGIILQNRYYEPNTRKGVGAQKMLRLKAVLEYMESNYRQNITLDELSQVAGMSPKYLCRAFREVFHKTPIDYLIDFRMEKACELLLEDKQSITDVAYLCGFNDSSYFSRCFRQYKNLTPKQYQKRSVGQKR